MLHLSSLRTISICSELWNQIVLPTFLFSIDIFYEYDTRNLHSLTRNSLPLPRNPRVPSLSATPTFLVIRPSQDLSSEIKPAATILLWSKMKCGYFYQRNLARKQWFRNLLHWRCLRYIFLRSGLLQSFKLQTTKTADSETAWTFFIKLLSKLPFYQTVTQNHFIYSSLASQSSPAFRRNEILMKSLNHSSITSNRIYSFIVQLKKGQLQTKVRKF